MTAAELERLFGAPAAGPRRAPRADRRGAARRRRRSPGASRASASWRSPRRLGDVFGYDWAGGAARPRGAPLVLGLGRRRPDHHPGRRGRPARVPLRDDPRGRPRGLRAGARPGAGAAAGRARMPRWACTSASRGCSRTSSAAAAPSAPGSGRRCAQTFGEVGARRAGRALPRGQRGGDRLHPHRGRRGPLQPPRHAALRPRAGADRPATSAVARPRGGLERPLRRRLRPRGARRRGAACCRTCTGRSGSSATSRPTRSATSTPPSSTRRSRRDLPDLDARLAAGELAPVVGWLGPRIHRRGRLLAPRALIAEASGREPDAATLLAQLEAKYGELYGL